MKLKHVDLAAGSVFQDAREVKTKFSKTFTTFFFPVGAEVRQIVDDWVLYLRRELLWGHDDPLFPATRVEPGASRQFEVVGLERKAWSSASPIRGIFKDAFEAAGLPYYNPHSLRCHAGAAGPDGVPGARGLQGVEPEPRSRGRADHFLQLRHRGAPSARGNHPGAGRPDRSFHEFRQGTGRCHASGDAEKRPVLELNRPAGHTACLGPSLGPSSPSCSQEPSIHEA